MKPSEFKTNLLGILSPPIMAIYEQVLIPKFREISKPAYENILFSKDESHPMLKHDWAEFYLDYERKYEQIKSGFISELIPGFTSSQIPKDYLSNEISDEIATKYLDTMKTGFDKFNFDDILNSSHGLNFEELDQTEHLFIKASIVQFYNSLSVIQSDKRINTLVTEFIEKRKALSLIKAVKVDPTVLKLVEVQKIIDKLPPIKKNQLETRIHNAKSIPHLTPDKRKQYLVLAVFLNLAASLGYLCPQKPITNKNLQNMAEELKIIPPDFDEENFRNIASYYRKLPFSRG